MPVPRGHGRSTASPGARHPAARRDRAAAGVDDFPRDIAPRDVRQGNADAFDAASLPEIEVVERAGADANDRMAGARFRIGRLLELQDFGTAMTVESNRFHATAI